MTKRDAIEHLLNRIAYARHCHEDWAVGVHIEALEIAVESMEEQRKGKWFVKNTHMLDPYYGGHYIDQFVCTNCESKFFEASKFCPNCGADMREEKTDD